MKLIDQKERDRIKTDLDTSYMVEASAGSGKTTSLVDRMTSLVGEGMCGIENIVAVTFTQKAASELKERFQIGLESERKNSTGVKKERFDKALNDLEQGFIGTIHSFCARLLRERPVEAGIDPGFTELDDAEDALFREEVWEDSLKSLLRADSSALERLEDLDVSAEELEGIYERLSMYPEVEAVRKQAPLPDISKARVELDRFIAYAEGILPERMPDNGWDAAQEKAREVINKSRIFDASSVKEFFKIVKPFESNVGVTLNRWPSRDIAREFEARIEKLKTEVLNPLLREWQEYRHFHLLNFVEPIAREYSERRINASRLNFQDLLLKASLLLKESPEVRIYFQKRYFRVFVDEFQDTDPIQAEVMLYLTGDDVKEKRWMRLKPRPGSLFIVGDPKQSIYRFRRADIDTYNNVKDIIKRSGGEVLELKSNFRSLKSVCEWINPVFRTCFPEGGTKYQAPEAGLSYFHEDVPGIVSGARKITISKISYHRQEHIVEEDSEKIASWIRHALDGNLRVRRSKDELKTGFDERPRPSDFMILIRYKNWMQAYGAKLEEYGIPYEISGGDAFLGAHALKELLKILKAIAEPDSEVDLVAAMRCMFFGINDEELYRFRKSGGRFSFFSNVPESAGSDIKGRIEPVYASIRNYREWSRRYTPVAAIERIMDDTGLVAQAITGEMGGTTAGNVMKTVEFLQGLEASGTTGFQDMVESMEEFVSGNKVDSIDINHKNTDAVRIMNLHKAKGLEAPVVFLANPSGKVDFGPDTHIVRTGEKTKGYFLVTARHGYQTKTIAIPPDWDNFSVEEGNYSQAEEARLMYVASTRAKQLLVISSYPHNNKSPWSIFDAQLASAPELVLSNVSQNLELPEEINITRDELEASCAGATREINRLKEPTYSVECVTDMAKGDSALPGWKRTGRGMKWGSLIHRALEAMSRGMMESDLELLIQNALSDLDLDAELKNEALGVVESVRRSGFWKEVEKAGKRLVEVPFSLRVRSSTLGPDFKGEWTVLSGVIDLAYKNEAGWNIVDYKTDDTSGGIAAFVKYYGPQVKAYCRYWEEMTGEKVAKAGLFFVKSGQLAEVLPS